MQLDRALTTVAVISLPLLAVAQKPSDDWQTIETEHFRVHYTTPYEQWTREVASKLEAIRDAANAEVGYVPPGITDVIVADPMAQANGSAWPFLGAPRMIFWASPPSPSGALGHESDWGELLAIHEWVHVAHLARPSRRPFSRVSWLLSPVSLGPIATAPRWISEGYATVLEGKLTGQGRPYSDYRAAILRTWAQRGRLPTYEQLDSDAVSWMGMSMAYLAGSAYLEWLVEKEGDDALRNLWARLTSREGRSFETAFEGIYGDSPKRLYQRFAAELTHRAILVENAARDSQRPGDLWMDLSWSTGEPDITQDGTQLVTIVRGRNKPSRIALFSTGPDSDAETAYARRIEKMLARDPEDVAPVRRKPLARKPKAELLFRPGELVQSPRWIGETGDILFVLYAPDSDGFIHPDLYRWSPGAAAARRLSFAADLRDARPATDGSFALAVRNRFGKSELVRVELASGSTRTLSGPALDLQFADPAPHPTLPCFAVVRRRAGKWELVVRDLAADSDRASIAFEGIVAQPAWARDGRSLFATVAREGFVEISKFDYDPDAGTLVEHGQVTRGMGASFAPVVSNDKLWFLGLDPDGLDLRTLPTPELQQPLPPIAIPPASQPVVRRTFDGPPIAITRGELGPASPYRIGRQELSPIFGGSYSPSGSVIEAGARLGDILGRLETLALISAGSDGAIEGGSIATRTRRLPIDLAVRVFAYEESPTEQKDGELTRSPDLDRVGVEALLEHERRWRGGSLQGTVAVYGGNLEVGGGESFSQVGSALGVRVSHTPLRTGDLLVPLRLDVSAQSGDTDHEGWTRARGELSLGVFSGGRGATLSLQAGTAASGSPEIEYFEIGGSRGSLLPDATTSNRIDVSALPTGVLRGRSFDSARLDLLAGKRAPALFVQRIGADVSVGDDEITLAGIELAMDVDAMPIARIPALELRVGAARVLDEGILEDETSFWVTTRWKL